MRCLSKISWLTNLFARRPPSLQSGGQGLHLQEQASGFIRTWRGVGPSGQGASLADHSPTEFSRRTAHGSPRTSTRGVGEHFLSRNQLFPGQLSLCSSCAKVGACRCIKECLHGRPRHSKQQCWDVVPQGHLATRRLVSSSSSKGALALLCVPTKRACWQQILDTRAVNPRSDGCSHSRWRLGSSGS